MTHFQLPYLIPRIPHDVFCDFALHSSSKPKPLHIRPLGSLELLWVNSSISSLFVPLLSVEPKRAAVWFDSNYPYVWVPPEVLTPLLEDSYVNLANYIPYENLIAACWVGNKQLLCFPTGELLDSLGVMLLDVAMREKLLPAVEKRELLPASSVYLQIPIRQLKLHIFVSGSTELLLCAAVTDSSVSIFNLTPSDETGAVQIVLVVKLPLRDQISNITFTNYNLIVTTNIGGIYAWDPARESELRVLKEGKSTVDGRVVCTQGSQYNSVFVASSKEVYSYDFRGKQTYQNPILCGEERIDDIHLSPTNPFNLAVHMKSLHLYDVRYPTSPFVSWARNPRKSKEGNDPNERIHSIHMLPTFKNTNLIVTARNNGEVFLFQYKDGESTKPKRVKWDPYQPLSSLTSPLFAVTEKFPHNIAAYPTQVPYSFDSIHTICAAHCKDIVSQLKGVAVLANWQNSPSESNFHVFQISQYGDVYAQSFTMRDYPDEEELNVAEVSELCTTAMLAYAERTDAFKTKLEVPLIDMPEPTHQDKKEVLSYLQDQLHPLTSHEICTDTFDYEAALKLEDFLATQEDMQQDLYAEEDKDPNEDLYQIESEQDKADVGSVPSEQAEQNILYKVTMDAAIANVPGENIHLNQGISEQAEADIKPYLETYFLNSPLLEPIVPVRTGLSRTRQDRAILEKEFLESKKAFVRNSRLKDGGGGGEGGAGRRRIAQQQRTRGNTPSTPATPGRRPMVLSSSQTTPTVYPASQELSSQHSSSSQQSFISPSQSSQQPSSQQSNRSARKRRSMGF